jgi:hypothetical protein
MPTLESDVQHAVGLALAGDWDAAHEIAQAHEGKPLADWLHAVLHRIEGDASNAAYWYARAGRAMPDGQDTDAELHTVAGACG